MQGPVSDKAGGLRGERADTGLVPFGVTWTRESQQWVFKRVRADKEAACVNVLNVDETALHLQPIGR